MTARIQPRPTASGGRSTRWTLALVLLGLPLLTWSGVEATSVPAFCSSCHEIEAAVASWRTSEHAARDGRDRADCRDCHVPPWSHPFDAVYVKATHGVADLYAKATRDPDAEFYFRLKQQTIAATADEDCLRCHPEVLTDEDVIETEEGEVRGLHRSDEAKKLKCITCHRGTGHNAFE